MQYQYRKYTGNTRRGNLEVISVQEIHWQYQERKSRGNISTGNILAIPGEEI